MPTTYAVTDNGMILTSQDGTSWNCQTSNQSISLLSVASGMNHLVVTGDHGSIFTAKPYAYSWSFDTTGWRSPLFDCIYGDGRFLIATSYAAFYYADTNFEWRASMSFDTSIQKIPWPLVMAYTQQLVKMEL